MRIPRRNPANLIGDILGAGIGAMLLVAAIEAVLLVVACCVGMFVWFMHGYLSGIGAGLLTFLVGKSLAFLALDMTLQPPERSGEEGRDPCDAEVLDSLRAELGSTAGQNDPPRT